MGAVIDASEVKGGVGGGMGGARAVGGGRCLHSTPRDDLEGNCICNSCVPVCIAMLLFCTILAT
jgi:hypothetical protein